MMYCAGYRNMPFLIDARQVTRRRCWSMSKQTISRRDMALPVQPGRLGAWGAR
jgi:hypothetical protein